MPINKILQQQLRMRRMMIGRKIKPKRYPKQGLPTAVERDYLTKLLTVLRPARELVEKHLIPALPGLLARAHADAAGARADGYVDDLQNIVAGMRAEFAKRAPSDPDLQAQLAVLAQRVDQFNSAQVNKTFKGVLDIEVTAQVPQLQDKIKNFTTTNVGLIKSIPDKFFTEIEQTVSRAFQAGTRAEDIQKDLRDRYGVTESKAALIARDQIGKFNGELMAARQKAVGVTRYIWRSSGDERVRDLHRSRDGQIFEWAKPPHATKDDGHPGTPIQCRCTADPVIEDLIGEEISTKPEASKAEVTGRLPEDEGPVTVQAPAPPAPTFAIPPAPTSPLAAAVAKGEEEIRGLAKEALRAYAPDGTELAALKGKKHSVDIPASLVSEAKKRGDVTITHNHPEGGPFSPQDINAALLMNLQEIRAVTPDGPAWVFSRPEKGWGVDLTPATKVKIGREVRAAYSASWEKSKIDLLNWRATLDHEPTEKETKDAAKRFRDEHYLSTYNKWAAKYGWTVRIDDRGNGGGGA